MMRDFLRDNQLPGGALAVRNGAVVYARGFGYADVEQREPVQPDSLFRIASLSKPVTAVATLQLVDAGRLRLDDRVLDLLPQRPFPPDAEVDCATAAGDDSAAVAASRRLGPVRIV